MRGFGRMLAAAVLGTATAWFSAPAWAANAADLTVTLAATPSDSVSVSRTKLAAYIAYRVTLVNGSTNTINQVKLTGATLANGTTAASYFGVVSNAGIVPTCAPTTTVGPSSVTCTIGQMKSQVGSDFFLLFQTPTDGSSLHLQLDTTFSEGGSPTSPPASVDGRTLTDDVVLTTTSNPDINAHVKTVLPPNGGRFFTGPDGQVNPTNVFTTDVTLPTVLTIVTTNAIDQDPPGPSTACSSDNVGYFCYGLSSAIQVNKALDNAKVVLPPASTAASVIVITLRQDASSLTVKKPTPSVNDVKIFYNYDTSTIPGVGSEVLSCAVTGGPAVNVPCVNARRDFLKGKKGYYEYEIWALENGKFSW